MILMMILMVMMILMMIMIIRMIAILLLVLPLVEGGLDHTFRQAGNLGQNERSAALAGNI